MVEGKSATLLSLKEPRDRDGITKGYGDHAKDSGLIAKAVVTTKQCYTVTTSVHSSAEPVLHDLYTLTMFSWFSTVSGLKIIVV